MREKKSWQFLIYTINKIQDLCIFTGCENKSRTGLKDTEPCNKTLPISLQNPKYIVSNVTKVHKVQYA